MRRRPAETSGTIGGVFDQDVVDDYWEHWRLFRGSRADRLEAQKRNVSVEVLYDSVQEGGPGVIELLVALAEAAPSDDDAGLVGAGPLENLLSLHGSRLATADGSALLDVIDTAARRSPRFRCALRSAYMGDEVPASVRTQLRRFVGGEDHR